MSDEVEQRLFLLLESVEQLKDAVQKQLDAIEYTRTQAAGITKYHHELEGKLNSAVERIENVQMTAEKIVSPLHEPIENAVRTSVLSTMHGNAHMIETAVSKLMKSMHYVDEQQKRLEKTYKTLLDDAEVNNEKFIKSLKLSYEKNLVNWKFFAVPLGAGVFAVLCMLLVFLFVPSRADIADKRNEYAQAKSDYQMYVDMQNDLKYALIKHDKTTNKSFIRVDKDNCVKIDTSDYKKSLCEIE